MERPVGAHQEIRKDRPFPVGSDLFRIYLDNFDQIEKVDAEFGSLVSGQASAQVLAVRQTYQTMNLPRHPKKAVEYELKSKEHMGYEGRRDFYRKNRQGVAICSPAAGGPAPWESDPP